MKFAKKMLMIPETEYLALIGSSRGGDYLQDEKALLDAQIRQNLYDPNIKQDLKAKKHSWLYKVRRSVKEMSENKPQRVTIANLQPQPNLAPYLGITDQSVGEKVEGQRRIKIPRKRIQGESDEQSSYLKSNGSVSTSDNNGSTTLKTPSSYASMSPEKPVEVQSPSKTTIIHPKLLNDLFKYVSVNKDAFKITAMGKIQSYRNLPIEESNYKDVLSYLTGGRKETPKGSKFLKDRLLKDPKIQEMVNASKDMWGEGRKRKKVIVTHKSIKTPGLFREPTQFKPAIWAKL